MDTQEWTPELNETRFAGELRSQLETVTPRRRRVPVLLASPSPSHRARRRPCSASSSAASPWPAVSIRCATPSTRCATPSGRRTSKARRSAAPAWQKPTKTSPTSFAVASDGKEGLLLQGRSGRPAALDIPVLGGGRGRVQPPRDARLRDPQVRVGRDDPDRRVLDRWARGRGRARWRAAPGHETASDVHGTRITTTEDSVDGSDHHHEGVARWSARRSTLQPTTRASAGCPAAERPKTWREITLWFRDDALERHGHTSSPSAAPGWLAERMSAAAREAGDPGAAGQVDHHVPALCRAIRGPTRRLRTTR